MTEDTIEFLIDHFRRWGIAYLIGMGGAIIYAIISYYGRFN